MTNGDALDFRYSNIEIINQYAGVQRKESASGQVQYQTKIHVNGDFIVGTYAEGIRQKLHCLHDKRAVSHRLYFDFYLQKAYSACTIAASAS